MGAYTCGDAGRITTRTRREAGSSYATDYSYDAAGQVVSETSAAGIRHSYVYGDANTSSFGTDLQRHTLSVTTAPAGSLTQARLDEVEECLAEAADCAASDESSIDTAFDDLVRPGSTVDPAALSGAAADVARFLKQRNGKTWTASAAFAEGDCIDPGAWGGKRFKVTTAGTTGSTEPTWPSSGTVSDGSVTWTENACVPIVALGVYEFDSNTPSKHQLVKQYDRFNTATYYHYDSRGNQDYHGSTAYVSTANQYWDELNRPTQLIDDTGTTITLTWYQDKYLLKSYSRGELCHRFQYDADERIRRIQQIADDDCVGTENWITDYNHDQAGLAAFTTGGATYYLDRNQRGDITGIRNDSGTLQATIRYTAYGEQYTDNQTLTDKLAHTYNGRDGVTTLGGGLYWMQARVYTSGQSRFVSADPLGGGLTWPDTSYGYGGGNPVNRIDPTGCVTVVEGSVVVVGIAILVAIAIDQIRDEGVPTANEIRWRLAHTIAQHAPKTCKDRKRDGNERFRSMFDPDSYGENKKNRLRKLVKKCWRRRNNADLRVGDLVYNADKKQYELTCKFGKFVGYRRASYRETGNDPCAGLDQQRVSCVKMIVRRKGKSWRLITAYPVSCVGGD